MSLSPILQNTLLFRTLLEMLIHEQKLEEKEKTNE
jgi:hypothetical protein